MSASFAELGMVGMRMKAPLAEIAFGGVLVIAVIGGAASFWPAKMHPIAPPREVPATVTPRPAVSVAIPSVPAVPVATAVTPSAPSAHTLVTASPAMVTSGTTSSSVNCAN